MALGPGEVKVIPCVRNSEKEFMLETLGLLELAEPTSETQATELMMGHFWFIKELHKYL